MKILVVEDDLALARELCFLCRRWGFEAEFAEEFEHVDRVFLESRADLVLLDINLPCFDGFYWCGKIREISTVPVLFLSSREQNADKVMAMAAGGDDYVEKPFDSELLLLKIRAMLRRTYEYKKSEREYLKPDMYYDVGQGCFVRGNERAELTRSENKIMAALTEHRGNVVSRESLMQLLWNTDEFVTDASLTVLISRLRGKLGDVAGGEEIIRTKKGRGYYVE